MPSTVFVTPEESIAAAYDNVGGLSLVTSMTANGVAYVEVQSLARWARGQPVIPPGTGVRKFAGYPSTSWLSSFITLKQLKNLRDNFEGEVTIRTLTDDDDTYRNYNAVLYVGELTDYTDRIFRHTVYGKGIADFVWRFSRLVLIP